jgi:hypothetical protein
MVCEKKENGGFLIQRVAQPEGPCVRRIHAADVLVGDEAVDDPANVDAPCFDVPCVNASYSSGVMPGDSLALQLLSAL